MSLHKPHADKQGFLNDYARLAGLNTITGGAGADFIDVGTGVDTVVIGTVATADIDVITGFGADDFIGFMSAINYVHNTNNLDAFGSLDLALADVVAGDPSVDAIGFTYLGNQYVVLDGDGSGEYNAANDAVAQLIATDLSTLSAGNFIA